MAFILEYCILHIYTTQIVTFHHTTQHHNAKELTVTQKSVQKNEENKTQIWQQ